MRKGIRWKIGNGQDTLFWVNNWALNRDLATTINANCNSIDLNLRLANFIKADHTWDVHRLQKIIPPQILCLIKGIPLPISDLKDCPIWGAYAFWQFLCKICNLASSQYSSPASMAFQVDLEIRHPPPKFRSFYGKYAITVLECVAHSTNATLFPPASVLFAIK